RRKYVDRETGDRVALLDQYLQSNGSNTLSPFLTEMVVKWAVKEPSYRDARDRFYELLGYQAMSHEKIRQKVLKIETKSVEEKTFGNYLADTYTVNIQSLKTLQSS